MSGLSLVLGPSFFCLLDINVYEYDTEKNFEN